jgi:stress-induced morphogen
MSVVERQSGDAGGSEALAETIEALVAHAGESRTHHHARGELSGGQPLGSEQPGVAAPAAGLKADVFAPHSRSVATLQSPSVADLDEIRAMIERALPGAEVEVIDETGTGDHLRATVNAPQFAGLSRIDQHRLVKAAVQERMDDGSIHALSVRTSTPS